MRHSEVFKFGSTEGYEKVISPDNSSLPVLGFGHFLLSPNSELMHEVQGEEAAIVLQSGDFTASITWKDKTYYEEVQGQRSNVFDELPTTIYLPPGSKIALRTTSGMRARVFTAVCDEGNPPFVSLPQDVVEGIPGALNWKRKYRFIFGPPGQPNDQVTKRLIVGESISQPGGWIGFPAHKHDLQNEEEFPLDEIFSYQLRGPEGAYLLQHSFGLGQRWDEVNVIDDDHCAIALADGYHTTVTVPGTTGYLLWGLAGKEKIYKIKFDSRFEWLFDAEQLYGF